MKCSLYVLIAFILFGCAKEEEVNNTPEKVGISRVVVFPTIETNGNRLVILNQGATYTEAGATAKLGEETAQYTTEGTVNTATPGVYDLTYTAANPDGFTASDFRTVVVIGNDVTANDLSGTYLRAATGVTSTWTKTAKGVYTVENPGGASVGVGLTAIAVNYTGNKIAIPQQISPDLGLVSSGSEDYNPTPPATIKYSLFAGGYGTALRTFVKQ